MKLNTRSLAFAWALGAVAAANAQRFYLADMSGVEISTATTIKIGEAVGSTVTLQIWVENGQHTVYTGGGLFVGFDRATMGNLQTYVNSSSAQAAGTMKKIALDDAFTSYATGLDGFKTSDFSAATVNITGYPVGEYKFRGAATATNTTVMDRSIGLNWLWYVGTAYRFNLAAGAKLRLSNVTITNKGLAWGEIFGDEAGENGLTINMDAATGLGSSYLADTLGPIQFGNHYYAASTVKYNVQAVPEPGTMLAIAAGLAGLAARRRRK